MSSKLQLQETIKTIPSSPVWDGIKVMSDEMIEKSVKEVIFDRDFIVKDGGDIVMIRK
jgi:hypothetical protein